MVTVLKYPGRDDRPSLRRAAPDPKAELDRAGYLAGRYGVPPDIADKLLPGMDIPTQTFLAIEMAEQRQSRYTAEYDPFGAM